MRYQIGIRVVSTVDVSSMKFLRHVDVDIDVAVDVGDVGTLWHVQIYYI